MDVTFNCESIDVKSSNGELRVTAWEVNTADIIEYICLQDVVEYFLENEEFKKLVEKHYSLTKNKDK